MREYDELVKALRHCAAYDCTTKCPRAGTGNGCVSGLKREAADAIEELLALAQNGASAIDITNRLAQKVEELAAKDTNVPDKWISVEERLPDGGVHVLACCRAKWLAGSGNLYVCDAFHSNPKTIVCSYDDDIDSEYDEETDEYYFPEGWWEVIKNWDDYSCVAIEDIVTHWMPLPEPPKEDKPCQS